jgi:hypothetical protein
MEKGGEENAYKFLAEISESDHFGNIHTHTQQDNINIDLKETERERTGFNGS